MKNEIKTIKRANEVTGGLSDPSKMPCYGYSIPASLCIVGSKLRDIVGSVCEGCYADKGNYRFSNVKMSLMNRYHKLQHDLWIDGMVFLIKAKSRDYFRWHDSGDLQSVDHLGQIVEVCYQTPKTKHWLPTRELGIVKQFITEGGIIPKNLVIRVSATMIDGKPTKAWKWTSTVTRHKVLSNCHAPDNAGHCGDCRKCWDKRFLNIAYLKH